MNSLNDNNSTNRPPWCTLDEAIKQNEATISFFFEAQNNNVTGCKGKQYFHKSNYDIMSSCKRNLFLKDRFIEFAFHSSLRRNDI